MKRVILVCGLPGAGKTTLARRLAAELGAVRLCPDEWLLALGLDVFDVKARDRVEKRLWALAEDLIATANVVVLENGFWSRTERETLRRRAKELGAAVELRYLHASAEERRRRVAARNEEPGAIVIGLDLLTAYDELFEAPTGEELAAFDPPAGEEPPAFDPPAIDPPA